MSKQQELFTLSKHVSQHAYHALMRARQAVQNTELALQRAQSLREQHHKRMHLGTDIQQRRISPESSLHFLE